MRCLFVIRISVKVFENDCLGPEDGEATILRNVGPIPTETLRHIPKRPRCEHLKFLTVIVISLHYIGLVQAISYLTALRPVKEPFAVASLDAK